MADDSMTKAELEAEAKKQGVDVNASMTKQEMIDAIEGGSDADNGDDEDSGMSEGERNRLVDKSGAEMMPGHQGNVIAQQIESGDITEEDLEPEEVPEEEEPAPQKPVSRDTTARPEKQS